MVVRASRGKRLNTLAIDVGGTGIKGSVLDPEGGMECDRVRVETPYPLSPQKLVLEIQRLIGQLTPFDRVSVGFPGMVRDGHILSAPHFVSASGPTGRPEPKLVRAWHRFDLAAALEEVTGRPTRVANDADMQGAAVIEGTGFEAVVTLGTGVGTAFFMDGILLPHFEFSHTPLSKAGSYNEVLGEATRRKIGNKKWRKRVWRAIEVIRALTFFDRCFIGGGNATHLGADLPEGVTIVDNTAGILGGIKLWDRTEAIVYAKAAVQKASAQTRPAAKKAPPATGKKAAPRRPAATSPRTRKAVPGAPVAATEAPEAATEAPEAAPEAPEAATTAAAPAPAAREVNRAFEPATAVESSGLVAPPTAAEPATPPAAAAVPPGPPGASDEPP